ncbi:response regulator transcription factor [Joostella sp. CR20]|uniref:response regulator transcription factor n=1 Tax=Joostella sp. CR20 TaxID=2804312 RepID=UPI00313D27D4
MKKYTIAIVDDHLLFAKSLSSLVESFQKYEVTFHAANGQSFINTIQHKPLPDIVLMDINMPQMNGIETMKWLKKHHPKQKVLALSMDDNETTIIQMLCHGAKGYILKDIHPDFFERALNDVIEKGFYYSDMITDDLMDAVMREEANPSENLIKPREAEFLRHACSEMTYKEIASLMNLSPKTIDGYRESLFYKLNLKSRVGLVLYGIRNRYVEI